MSFKNFFKITLLIIFLIFLGFACAKFPFLILGFVFLIIVFFLSLKYLRFGLGLVFLLIICGQVLRIPFSEGREMPILDLYLPILISAWLFKKGISDKLKFKKTPLDIPILLFIFVAFLSLFWQSQNLAGNEILLSAMYFFRFIEYAFLFFITVDLVSFSGKRELGWIFFSAFCLAFLGFFQLIFFPDFSSMTSQGWDPHQGRLLSTWFDPNILGGFFSFVLAISLSLILFKESFFSKKIFLPILICFLLVALIFTYSRSSYLALVGIIFLLGFLKSKKLLFFSLILSLLIIISLPRIQQRLVGAKNIDETALERIKSWQQTFGIIEDHPFLGIGYNALPYAKLDYGIIKDLKVRSAAGSDSSFLTIWVTTGSFGLILYLWIYLQILWFSFKNFLDKSFPSYFRALSLGIFVGIIGLFIHSQFTNSLLYPFIMAIVWISVGIMFGVSFREESNSE